MAGGAKVDQDEARRFVQAWRDAVQSGMRYKQFAAHLGLSHSTVAARRRTYERVLGIKLESFASTKLIQKRKETSARLRAFSVTSERPTPADDLPVEDLVAQRIESTKRKLRSDKLRELVDIALDVSGPFGIAMIGDPHIDNPGCNLELLIEHTRVIAETDGLFAVCVGDLQDNWVGRLARLWASQGVAARDSQRMVDWWLNQFDGKLLAVCEGNHDAWAIGHNGLSPVAWIESKLGAVLERDGVRLRIHPNDGAPVTINMRHDFPGRSQYNAAHGPNKSLLFGCRDDVAVAGHTHEFGMGVRLDPETRKPMHAVRLGSYKHSDEYARTLGLLDNNVTECAVLMVDPTVGDPRHRTWVETDPFRAARILEHMRSTAWQTTKTPTATPRKRKVKARKASTSRTSSCRTAKRGSRTRVASAKSTS